MIETFEARHQGEMEALVVRKLIAAALANYEAARDAAGGHADLEPPNDPANRVKHDVWGVIAGRYCAAHVAAEGHLIELIRTTQPPVLGEGNYYGGDRPIYQARVGTKMVLLVTSEGGTYQPGVPHSNELDVLIVDLAIGGAG